MLPPTPLLSIAYAHLIYKQAIRYYIQNSRLDTHRKIYYDDYHHQQINPEPFRLRKTTMIDHKRFLILQGEVESIAQMKPKAEKDSDDGLLEYLEDIIGTSKYKNSIEDATTNIEELNDICVEKKRRFDFVEKSKDELVAPKNEALEYLAQEKKFLDKKTIYLQLSLRKDRSTLKDEINLLPLFLFIW